MAALAGITLFRDGCLTRALWEDTSSLREPAVVSVLRLDKVPAREQVLVQYDEAGESRSRIRRRAFFLEPNQARIAARHKPRFVNPARFPERESIPVYPVGQVNANRPATGTFAATATNNAGFILYSGGRELGAYSLPVCFEYWHCVGQIALTPLTVAADASLWGMVLAAIWGYMGTPGLD